MTGQPLGGLADPNTAGFQCRGVAHLWRLHPVLGRLPQAQERPEAWLDLELIDGSRATSERKVT
jgi:hypothetical protein